ncbi:MULTISPECIES: SGNH/GDSL hydrolase family protein [Pseudomonas]|uniref:IopA n=1 Tax=Pseudomonas chlororaphis TaxID=333 RepID=Q2ERQ6_PSECL|nr:MULTISPECIES: inducer of phenazine A [Pseudomonas]ABD16206.1 IopA [Pseudomonas chlororaphis]AVO57974.1 inducer of phenazine A [Pseudomonas chlororaphis subsp. piscium]AZC49327.1 hypothetical protein C4K35_1729 [Pseudomonas chlororaphis subsp. piscium]AZC55954.1 hypothetical protein C4K34_1774 [Pseudomonas chlororaphis subsp. piscium]AZC62214.1 hypothetical protein C4K33_1707 [Pseudomonas chlororaphis subsp. piscium]
MTARIKLTPQMAEYEQKFTDGGEVRWLPYLMYFHPTDHSSEVVNTDASGFRYSELLGIQYSVVNSRHAKSVRVLAGSSTVFGIGASSDAWTLPSRLAENDPDSKPWINFGGRSFNSTQELTLFTLYRHLLPKVDEIVLFSGFNNLGLARQPQSSRGEHGAFFNCNQFFDAMRPETQAPKRGMFRALLGKEQEEPTPEPPPSMEEQIEYAADLTLRHLDTWRALAADMGAKLTFILQPLAGWVREKGCDEEEQLFAELDRAGSFSEVYGDILQPSVCEAYAARLREGAQKMGVRFVNITPLLSEALRPEQWLFVDRIHFTDQGNDFVSKIILDVL